jgi:SAM-dependent methyltransferase
MLTMRISNSAAHHELSLDEFINSLRDSPYWNDRGHAIQYLENAKFRFHRIIEAIPTVPRTLTLLDIGTSAFTVYLKQRYPQYAISTVDLTPYWADHCAACGIHFHCCDVAATPLPYEPESFDVVIFTEILEHLDVPPTWILRNIHQVLRQEGVLIFSVPNLASLRNRVKLLFGISPLELLGEQFKTIHGHGHLREYTLTEATTLLTAAQFQIRSMQYLQPSVMDVLKRPYEPLLQKIVKGVYYCTGIVPSLRLTILFQCQKQSD